MERRAAGCRAGQGRLRAHSGPVPGHTSSADDTGLLAPHSLEILMICQSVVSTATSTMGGCETRQTAPKCMISARKEASLAAATPGHHGEESGAVPLPVPPPRWEGGFRPRRGWAPGPWRSPFPSGAKSVTQEPARATCSCPVPAWGPSQAVEYTPLASVLTVMRLFKRK